MPHVRRHRAATLVRLATAVAIAAGLGGCANLYLHSDTRQQQAEATTKAWGEVETTVLFAAEREKLDKLAQAEQQTQVRVAAAIRDRLAGVVVAGGRDGEDRTARERRSVGQRVLAQARAGFVALVGPLEGYDERVKASDQRAPIEREIDMLTPRLQAAGSPVVVCTDLGERGALPPNVAPWLQGLSVNARTFANRRLGSLSQQCERLRELRASQAGADMPHGLLKSALEQRKQDQHQLELQRALFEREKGDYDAALEAYQQAEAAASAAPTDATLAARVGRAAQTLRASIGVLRGLQNAFAQEFVAAETIASIDAALAAVVAGETGEGAKKGVILAVQAPALIDRYRAAIAEAKKPLVLPLLLRRNAEQLQRDAAANDVALLQAKVSVSQRIVDAVQTQASALRRSIRELEAAGQLNPATLDQPWTEALAASNGHAKRLLLNGAAGYIDAMSRLEGERYRLEYARIALDHQRGLAYAETSVAQWANLIGIGVGQLEDFAKGGIDKTVLTDMARVLGLFWIGHGVNNK